MIAFSASPITQTAPDLLSLIGHDVPLRRQASTRGGEYAGPCPFCGGSDRFRVWPYAERPGWWCRRCEQSGDAIGYLALRTHVSRGAAAAQLGLISTSSTRRELLSVPPEPVQPPPPAWRSAANTFVEACYDRLWSASGAIALRYLQRVYGLNEQQIVWGMLGYNDRDQYVPRAEWGLEPREVRKHGRLTLQHNLWLPRGIVIPWLIVADIWKISIRRLTGTPKYYQLPGGSNALYGADGLWPCKPALLCEGMLDALAVREAAGDLVSAVASGATGARSIHWILKLAQTPLVLLAFDQDEGGDRPEAYWSEVLPQHFVWRPYVDDPAAMHAAGMSVRSWVEAGLAAAGHARER
jgi:DNA primase